MRMFWIVVLVAGVLFTIDHEFYNDQYWHTVSAMLPYQSFIWIALTPLTHRSATVTFVSGPHGIPAVSVPALQHR
jgi:hypothetical protein